MRRLLAVAAGALGLLVLPAVPASAAFSQAVWTSPAGVRPPAAGSDDWTATVANRTTPQQVTLGGVFDHPDGVERVNLVLEQSEYPEGEPPCSPTGFPQAAVGAASGATTFSFEVLLPCNGTYVVRANATSRGSLGSPQETRAIRLVLTVAVPPVPVQGLRAVTEDDGSSGVALSWEPVGDADRDADFAGYDIERAVDGGDYEIIASLPDPEASSYVDTQPDPAGGSHRYRVASLRRAGADDADGVVSARETSSAVTVDLPSEDTTTDGTVAGAGAGGGGAPAPGRSGSGRRVVTSGRRTTTAGPRTVTTVDDGFQETLPFEPGDEQALPAGDPAVVAEIDDGGDGAKKQTLALVAGGSAMAVGALLLRRVLRQAASPYEVLQ